MTRGGGTTAKYRAALMEEQKKKEMVVTVHLNATEYNNMVFALGFAAGAAMTRGEPEIGEGFRRLFETVAKTLWEAR